MTETNTYILSHPSALAQAIRLERVMEIIKAEVEHAQSVIDACDSEQKRIMRHLAEGAINHDEATKAWDAAEAHSVALSRQVNAAMSSLAFNSAYLEKAIEDVKQ